MSLQYIKYFLEFSYPSLIESVRELNDVLCGSNVTSNVLDGIDIKKHKLIASHNKLESKAIELDIRVKGLASVVMVEQKDLIQSGSLNPILKCLFDSLKAEVDITIQVSPTYNYVVIVSSLQYMYN